MKLSQQTCQAELSKYNLIPRKYHGQVFTTDPKVIDKFIETIKTIYRPGTKIVEIGGGLGYITEQLIRHFDDVDCLEIDDELFGILSNKFVHLENNIPSPVQCRVSNKIIVHKDIMASNKEKTENPNKIITQNIVSRKSLIVNRKSFMSNSSIHKAGLRLIHADIMDYEPNKQNYLLVGNIPFHISGKLYRKFMSEIDHKPYGMVFITDKQYAKTLMGQPPRCYRASLQAQAYGDIEIVADVPPASVYPPPRVMSCIMKITQNPTPLPQNFWKVVNYHYENFPTKEIESPKTLSLKDWVKLCGN